MLLAVLKERRSSLLDESREMLAEDAVWVSKLLDLHLDHGFHKSLDVQFRGLSVVEFAPSIYCLLIFFPLWRLDHVNGMLERIQSNIVEVLVHEALFLICLWIPCLADFFRLIRSVSADMVSWHPMSSLRIKLVDHWLIRSDFNWYLFLLNCLLRMLWKLLKGWIELWLAHRLRIIGLWILCLYPFNALHSI